jgi:hypothetical protein
MEHITHQVQSLDKKTFYQLIAVLAFAIAVLTPLFTILAIITLS